MTHSKTPLTRFENITWRDLDEWAGNKIVSRGKSYQRQGAVSDLVITEDGGLLAWVIGSKRYATKVVVNEEEQLESFCTCPYEWTCKHAVAMVIEYLKRIENSKPIPRAKTDDERLELLGGEYLNSKSEDEEGTAFEFNDKDVHSILQSMTKTQLIKQVEELSQQNPEIAQSLTDRQRLKTGNTNALVSRLRREIRDMGDEPGWQNYWHNEGFTPDFSKIRNKLETLLKAGYADEVLNLGKELIETGNHLVESSNDEGETGMEVASCMTVITEALDQSSLESVEKLNWALDAVFKDQFDICEAFAQYLHRPHPESAWNALADRLIVRLNGMKSPKGVDNFSRNYDRDRLSNWIIHVLEQSGREDEIIPLCEKEAPITSSYERLVSRLIVARRLADAERWIMEGLRALKEKWPGISNNLRDKLREVRKLEKNWHVVAALQIEELVRSPSLFGYNDCKKACDKIKVWPDVRDHLLIYLEKGDLPWLQEGWQLPESGLDRLPKGQKSRFPILDLLMGIAIEEQKPDQVLRWFDQLPKRGIGWREVTDDDVAGAVQTFAPDRAIAIWKNAAEELIAQVKPRAYQDAVVYLRKAQSVASLQNKQDQWDQYILELRIKHRPKRKLMEILDGLEGKPILKKRK